MEIIYIPYVDSADHYIYVPLISSSTIVMSIQAKELESLIINAEEQQRTTLEPDPILMRVAQERAQYMADHNIFMHDHLDLNGVGPNQYAIRAGFDLPDWYNQTLGGNNIESLAAGQQNANDVMAGWRQSVGHNLHIFGGNVFYARQTKYGIGFTYKPGTDYGYYWSVIIAEED